MSVCRNMTCIVVCNSGCPLNWLGKVSAHFKTCRLWGPTPDLLNWHCWQEWVSINFYKNSTLLMLKHRSWIQAAAFFIYLSWLLSHHLQWQEASWKKAPKDWMYAVNLWWPVWCVTFLSCVMFLHFYFGNKGLPIDYSQVLEHFSF